MTDLNANLPEAESADAPGAAQPGHSNLPLIITLAALTIFFGFETLQRLTERANLTAVKGNQNAAIQEAQKVQSQFKLLVGKTSELADQGHVGAKMIMDELLKRGVGSAPEASVPGKAATLPAK